MPSSRPPATLDDPLHRLEAQEGLPFDQFVTFRVNQLSMAFERQWTRYMREHVGLSLAEWRIVATLAGRGSLTFAQVVRATGMNKSLASRCVTALEEQGLVDAAPTPTDSRSLTLSLTRRADKLVKQLRPTVLRRQRLLLEALNAQERRVLYTALDKLQAAAATWGAGED